MTQQRGQMIKDPTHDGVWRLRWFEGRNSKGKRIYRSKTVHGKRKAAEKELRRILHSKDVGKYGSPSRVTVDELLDKWLDEAHGQRVSGRTLATHRTLLDTHVREVIGHRRIDQLNTLQVQELLNGMSRRRGRKLSPRTHQIVLQLLRSALRKARTWNFIAHDPTDDVEVPRDASQRGKRRVLSIEELRRFLAEAGKRDDRGNSTRWLTLWSLAATTGARPGELLALTWADIDLDRGEILICRALTKDVEGKLLVGPTKTQQTRRVSIDTPVIDTLAAHRLAQREYALGLGPAYDRSGDLVFPTHRGALLHTANVRREYLAVAKAAGITGARGPYDLRHTAASQLLEAGVPVTDVAQRLGHSVDTLTTTYAHALPDNQRRVADIAGKLVFGR